MKHSCTVEEQIPSVVALFGLPIANVTMARAIACIEESILSGQTHQIATANLDFARNSLRDQYLQRIICDCTMVLPDGAPLVWASHLLGSPLQQRVTGVDLIPELAKLSAEKRYGIFLLGSSEQSSQKAAQVLEYCYPGVRIVGRFSPEQLPLHRMDHEDILRRIEEASPDVLLVAFGNPKQEIWIHRHRSRLKVPVAIGIGGALDMIAGSLKRAPAWVQRLQMEWFFRMAQEPLRLLPRYARDAAALMRHLPLGWMLNHLQPGERSEGPVRVDVQDSFRTVATPATLCGDCCAWITREARAAASAGQTLIIDLSATTRVEADGLGCLLEARRILLGDDLWIWLAGMSNPVRRVLQFASLADLFRLAVTSAEAIRFTAAARPHVSPKAPLSVPQVVPEARRNSGITVSSVARAS